MADSLPYSLNCKGKLFFLDEPKVMGILNITPNSFFDGGKYQQEHQILKRAEQMLDEGATFIDIGAYSSRPNAEFVSEEEELNRIVNVVEMLLKHFPDTLLSIDTFRAKVAKETLDAGAAIINDISAGMLDEQMLDVAGKAKAPYIMMHMRGTPQNMQKFTHYDDLIKDILYYFSERADAARKAGINDLIIDPGFGFAKTLEQNYALLKQLELFETLNLPLLAGLSRKSMIYKVLGHTPAASLNGTTVLQTIALQKGAKILRVHDVKEATEIIKLVKKLE